jgi:hypothetical protein
MQLAIDPRWCKPTLYVAHGNAQPRASRAHRVRARRVGFVLAPGSGGRGELLELLTMMLARCNVVGAACAHW